MFEICNNERASFLYRCIAINSIGIYLYEELMNKTNHYRIKEAVTVLLIAVRVKF